VKLEIDLSGRGVVPAGYLLGLKARLLLAFARSSVADPGTISARSNAH
jgi:hypothetical protein